MPMRWTARNVINAAVVGGTTLFILVYLLPTTLTPRKATHFAAFVTKSTEISQLTGTEGDFQPVHCVVNDKKRVDCVKKKRRQQEKEDEDGEEEEEEVYMPFYAFIKGYFKVFGLWTSRIDGEKVFEFWHSTSKLQEFTIEKYGPTSVFGAFATYGVENRDRVRCLSGTEDVPMSTQWDDTPYFYAVQIAQYGLQHYSRDVSLNKREKLMGTHIDSFGKWKIPPDVKSESKISQPHLVDGIEWIDIETKASFDNPGVFLDLDPFANHELQFSIVLLEQKSSFSVLIQRMDTRELINIHYTQTDNDQCLESLEPKSGREFSYSLGREHWKSADKSAKTGRTLKFGRNILVDANRALFYNQLLVGENRRIAAKKVKLAPDLVKLISLSVNGRVRISRHLKQLAYSHREHFLSAARWFVRHQDSTGGYPVPASRTLAEGKLKLAKGWNSAMAQGHALSLLTRAFTLTKNLTFLDTARRAAGLFAVPAEKGGILNHFLGELAWYEEYPTTPGTFVLNGFIYSLIGLFDLANTETSQVEKAKATTLYRTGVESLKALLPLYDTGSGSTYDLRHLGLKTAPNLARDDYHAVHIYQLKWLYNMEQDEMFREYAARWESYAFGHRAKHN